MVEAAARQVIVNGGYGPDYNYFTHRLGHGIGIQGHEEPYLVRNNTVLLQPGMTFSVEPGIYIPNEVKKKKDYYLFLKSGCFLKKKRWEFD